MADAIAVSRGGRAAVAGSRRPPAALVAASAVGALLVLLPLAYTVLQATRVDAEEAVELLLRPLVGELLANTIGLVLATTVAAAILGTGVRLADGAHAGAGPAGLGGTGGGAAGHPAVHQQLCLGVAQS